MKQCKILWKCSLSVVVYVTSTYAVLNLDRWALGVWKAVQGCVVSKVLHSVSAFLDSSTLQLFFDLYHSIPPSFSPLVSLVFTFLTDSATRRCCRIHLGGLQVVKCHRMASDSSFLLPALPCDPLTKGRLLWFCHCCWFSCTCRFWKRPKSSLFVGSPVCCFYPCVAWSLC